MMTVAGPERAHAAGCSIAGNNLVDASLQTQTCADYTAWSGGFLTILSGATVTGSASGASTFRADSSPVTSFTNNGTLNADGTGVWLSGTTAVQNFINNGTISAGNGGSSYGLLVYDTASISNITNTGTIYVSGPSSYGIAQYSTGSAIGSIVNSGRIYGTTAGIYLRYADSKINTITNTGIIDSNGLYGIFVAAGTISTLNNYQGVYGSGGSKLVYRGALPSNYNVIVNGTGYGQLDVSNPGSSTTTFGVSTQDTRMLQQGKIYGSVLSGVPLANLNNTTGKVGDRGTFTLKQNGTNTWDMTIDGLWTPVLGYMNPSVTNTYSALSSNRDAVSGALHQRYAVLNAVMEYDCQRFDKYGVCLSFQARSTGWGDQTTGAGVFNIAKRITDNVRAGVYLDYQAAQSTPYATNGYAGGIQWGYNNPTFGGYVGWSDHADGTGIQARVSGGYNPGKLTINRAMLDYSEPGSGTAGLNAYYAYGLAGYGVSVGNGVIITPYGGLRYTDVTRNAYTENFNLQSVIFPLGYNAYYEQLITGLAGSKVQAMLSDKFGLNVALGGEFDFTRNANGYTGYSVAPGLQAWGVAHGGVWNGVRPAGIIGTFYDVNKNDRLMLNAYVGEQAWTSRAYSTLIAGYQVAF